MVVIRITKSKAGLITEYAVEGHSGLNESGKDILCAALSAITQTPILGLEQHLHKKPQITLGDGFLQVKLDGADEKTQLLLATMVSAIEQLKEEYPQYLRIEGQR